MTMANNVRVLKVEDAGRYAPDIYRVSITKRQMMKLPSWVRRIISFYEGDNPQHVCTSISAKDELEAMMRFRKLWDALSVFHEEN
jgi:hypothetical protein